MSGFAKRLFSTDPERALQWVSSITNEEDRTHRVPRLLNQWRQQDAVAAEGPTSTAVVGGWMPITGTCDLEERLGLLERVCNQKGRDRNEINVTLFAAPSGQAEIDQLEKIGVDRILLPLPTEDEEKILRRLDGYISLIAG